MSQVIIQVILLVIRYSLATVLIAAGSAKLADTRSFANTLIGLGIFAHQESVIRILTVSIPLLEAGVGITAISGLWVAATNVAVVILMGSFSIMIIFALRKRLHVVQYLIE